MSKVLICPKSHYLVTINMSLHQKFPVLLTQLLWHILRTHVHLQFTLGNIFLNNGRQYPRPPAYPVYGSQAAVGWIGFLKKWLQVQFTFRVTFVSE
jgi:hypothetical protein